MTPEAIKNTMFLYINKLKACNKDIQPKNNEDASNELEAKEYVYWLCNKIIRLVDDNKADKAIKLVGFIMGVLWSIGEYDISDFRNHSTQTFGAT
jgi:hypothetical protein